MTDTSLAAIDRRIEIIGGADTKRNSIPRVSDLRQYPFVVLLGEPGIGKTTVFEQEAAHEGAIPLKVRDLMNGDALAADKTAYLDALDEYRVDGQASDKILHLAKLVAASGVSRWRLSCRSEDWRKAADIGPMQKRAAKSGIVVAQLMPLDDAEAEAILTALGETDAKGFIQKAHAMGASGFAESPLSLKLLQKSIQDGGTWPQTRFELFASAIERLAHEFNDEYARTDRTAPNTIIAAAGTASLNLLISGARAIWRSNTPPPNKAGERRGYVTSHDISVPKIVLEDALDTALFRGEGESFEPMHRTIAEYLAGQTLAEAVIGGNGKAAFPLNRALALISGWDGRAPTELRGLFAWFAAHLAKRGEKSMVAQILAIDPVTPLVYGDVAVMDVESRRTILRAMGENDPYFRSSEVGITAVGGLASDDLAKDFIDILTSPHDGTHRLLTVFEVLTIGKPVKAVLPTLKAIALDTSRPEWHRWRAGEAWLNGADDQTKSRRALLDDLKAEAPSAPREHLRANLASRLPRPILKVEDIKSIIADTQSITGDDSMLQLYGLRRVMVDTPWPELFDVSFDTWLPDRDKRQHLIETEHLLDGAFASAIRGTPGLTAKRIIDWHTNVYGDSWFDTGSDGKKAVQEWADRAPGNETALFFAVADLDDPAHGPWVVGNNYIMLTGRLPSAAAFAKLLDDAKAESDPAAKARLTDIATSLSRNGGMDPAGYWALFDYLTSENDAARLESLTVAEIDAWRLKQQQRHIAQSAKDAKQRDDNVAILKTQTTDLETGKQVHNLSWAAQLYFDKETKQGRIITGLDHVRYYADQDTSDAIFRGWHHLATHDWPKIDAAELGRVEAEGRHFYAEYGAIAGLDQLIDRGTLPDISTMPLLLAISVIRLGYIANDESKKKALEDWAIGRLAASPVDGATALSSFWVAALKTGHPRADGVHRLMQPDAMHPAISGAIERTLNDLPNMPLPALRDLLRAARVHLDASRLGAIAAAALARSDLEKSQRAIWHFVEYALEPSTHREAFLKAYSDPDANEVLDEALSEGMLKDFDGEDVATRAQRAVMTIRLLGPAASPDDQPRAGRVTRPVRTGDTVRREITWLGTLPDKDVGAELTALINEPAISHWQPLLRHALAQHSRLRRDSEFVPPAPSVINAALSGGAPVNAADLRAIVMDELSRLRDELRTTDTTPWKHFWNRGPLGEVKDPLVENQCRDYLLTRLQDRLAKYKIAAALPEARRGEETRADMLILSAIGKDLPVEAKRHYHADIWIAAGGQLQGYTAAPNTDGYGIYLVFWFGNDVSPTPARADGRPGPNSGAELEQMLKEDLSDDLKERTSVIVFDVSNPDSAKTGKPRQRRSPSNKSATPKKAKKAS